MFQRFSFDHNASFFINASFQSKKDVRLWYSSRFVVYLTAAPCAVPGDSRIDLKDWKEM